MQCSVVGDVEGRAAGGLAQDRGRAPVAGQAAVVGAEQDGVGGAAGGQQVLLVGDGIVRRPDVGDRDERRRAVELAGALGADRGLQPLQRLGPEDAEAPRVGEVVVGRPAAELEQLGQQSRGRRARTRRPCACAGCGSPPRRPSAVVLVLVVVGVERLAGQLAPGGVEDQHVERVAAVVVGRQQREAVLDQDALVDGRGRRARRSRSRRGRRRACPRRASSPRRCRPRRASRRRPPRRGRSSTRGWPRRSPRSSRQSPRSGRAPGPPRPRARRRRRRRAPAARRCGTVAGT